MKKSVKEKEDRKVKKRETDNIEAYNYVASQISRIRGFLKRRYMINETHDENVIHGAVMILDDIGGFMFDFLLNGFSPKKIKVREESGPPYFDREPGYKPYKPYKP